MVSSWNLIYERWMIDDGLLELTVGQSHQWFAIWFNAEATLQQSQCTSKAVTTTGDFRYSVTAQVVFHSDQNCVIDFGLRAIGAPSILPDGVAAGDYVIGDIQLGLEHSIAMIPDEVLQSLAYTWRVDKILACKIR